MKRRCSFYLAISSEWESCSIIIISCSLAFHWSRTFWSDRWSHQARAYYGEIFPKIQIKFNLYLCADCHRQLTDSNSNRWTSRKLVTVNEIETEDKQENKKRLTIYLHHRKEKAIKYQLWHSYVYNTMYTLQ